jgi:nitrate reductase delta subunit
VTPEAATCKLAALLLAYPDGDWQRRLAAVEEALAGLPPSRAARDLADFVAAVRARPLRELQEEYVETFDFASRTPLHLTAVLFGEERDRGRAPQRGHALAQLGEVYAAHGYELADGELPDYLPALLEFVAAAGCPPELAGHAGVLERAMASLAEGLAEAGSAYAAAVRAARAGFHGVCRRRKAS